MFIGFLWLLGFVCGVWGRLVVFFLGFEVLGVMLGGFNCFCSLVAYCFVLVLFIWVAFCFCLIWLCVCFGISFFVGLCIELVIGFMGLGLICLALWGWFSGCDYCMLIVLMVLGLVFMVFILVLFCWISRLEL